jgi:hypothetical protein
MRDDAVEIQFQLHPEPRLRADQDSGGQPVASAGRLPRVTQVLALALSFQDMVKRGEAKDYADLARLGGVTRERLSQIMKLAWLAPDIQQEILYLPPTPGGRYPVSELAMRKIGNVLSWAEQRRQWQELKKSLLVGSCG